MPNTTDSKESLGEIVFGKRAWGGIKVVGVAAVAGHYIDKAIQRANRKRDSEYFRQAYADSREQKLAEIALTDVAGQDTPELAKADEPDQELHTDTEELVHDR